MPTFLYSIAGPIIFISGLVEIGLGGALLFLWKERYRLGWWTSIYLFVVSAGNGAQFRNGVDAFGLNTDGARFIRLLFQPLLILWVLWATEAWKDYRSSSRERNNVD